MQPLPPTVRRIPRARADRLGEGPLWVAAENAVYWVDVTGQRLNRLSLDDESVAEWAMPEMIGWVISRRQQPGFIAGLKSGIAELQLDPLRLTPLVAPEPLLPLNRMNDAVADGHGRIYAGTMPIGCDTPTGSLYRFDPDGTLTLIDSDYIVTNGPAISPDGAWLYHTDSVPRLLYRFPVRPDGSLGARQLFRQFAPDEGHPDGMTFDSDGGLWVACWGAGCVVRLRPDGGIDTRIAVPATQTSSCCFAGAGLDRMFVTSSADGVDEPEGGALFEVTTGRRGLLPEMFAG
jgi:sugar lactone lactonase YvrE